MRKLVALFLLAAAAVALAWWWLGRPLAAPAAAADPGRIQCVSYAPFRGGQTPLIAATHAEAAQIEEDLAKLVRLTGCVRTYATDNGLDQVPGIAQRLGLKVLQGLWLDRDRQKNRIQIDTAIALAKRYPDTIIGIVVGNEVLLRGELAASDIGTVLHEVKSATGMPVTYADVWEFWLRNRELAAAVDFVTIHILPYWEDFPIAADIAAAHVDDIRSRVAAVFPGKEILIGEVGWPSAGRMREGALPSPSNQAHVLEEVMARARAKNYRVNLIEAFDQPWKRHLEGTVGGYWGLLGSSVREPKFAWGEPVSDHPLWPWQLAFGLAMLVAVFAAAIRSGGGTISKAPGRVLVGVAVIGLVAGITAPWGLENVIIESFGLGGWLRAAAFAAVALAAPIAAATALAANETIPAFARVLGRSQDRPASVIARASGLVLVATTILAIQTALGLVFDPRYRDFTDAQLSAAVVPLAVAVALGVKRAGPRARAETIAAVTSAASAVYIVLNEGFANWQALWFGAVLIVLAVTLDRLPDAQSS
ncbi:MAG TPA: beta-(1-6) glucans synthase [Xanthobacteraceae bacterium]|nr:beta-(1-6) glucans synthase [Xanthobacteraceae bacterium]